MRSAGARVRRRGKRRVGMAFASNAVEKARKGPSVGTKLDGVRRGEVGAVGANLGAHGAGSVFRVGEPGDGSPRVGARCNSSERIAKGSLRRGADAGNAVRLPRGGLAAEPVVLVARREPRHVRHVKGDEPGRGRHAALHVVVPGRGGAVGLRFGHLVAAVPDGRRDLPGQVLAPDDPALGVEGPL